MTNQQSKFNKMSTILLAIILVIFVQIFLGYKAGKALAKLESKSTPVTSEKQHLKQEL